ncbi:LIM domain transcription factor LMO4, partial [Lamprotornis superbus]
IPAAAPRPAPLKLAGPARFAEALRRAAAGRLRAAGGSGAAAALRGGGGGGAGGSGTNLVCPLPGGGLPPAGERASTVLVSLQEDLFRHPERRSPAFCNIEGKQAMVNPGGSAQPPPVTAGSLSWKRCAGCGGKIADRFLLYAMDSYWHSRCLKCSCCQAQLGDIGTSCYTKSGMILCRNDYIRLFGNSGACSACGQSIPASELVMRAQGNVYHLKCFTCSTCRNRLVPGDRFHYINGSLFCEHDRPTALINGHLNSLQSNPLLPDQKASQRPRAEAAATAELLCLQQVGRAPAMAQRQLRAALRRTPLINGLHVQPL